MRRAAAASFLLLNQVAWAALPSGSDAVAQPPKPQAVRPPTLSERLTTIRSRVIVLEQSLIDGVKAQGEAKRNIQRIQALMKLQREERELGIRRTAELEKTIGELQVRRGALRERISVQQGGIRKFLAELGRTRKEPPRSLGPEAHERIESPRLRVLAGLVQRGLSEIETLKVDLQDADQLEQKIQEEQQQLAYLFQDLKEQESVLELNRMLQVDMLKKRHQERVSQLENYRKLKSAEGQVEGLIRNFNARRELEKAVETERLASRSMRQGAFARLKGSLTLPVAGKVVSFFGRAFDPKSSLQVFKKGVDIDAGAARPVKAISAGRVAFSGELPNYGRVTIIDHGDHYYSLCANLGELRRQVGDAVRSGDEIGTSDASGSPVYFEIRSRNIAVNPLQWIADAR